MRFAVYRCHGNSHHGTLFSFHGVVKCRSLIAGCDTVAFLLPEHTVFQYVPQQNAFVCRLCDIRDIRPVTSFAVLSGNKCRIYGNRLNTEMF